MRESEDGQFSPRGAVSNVDPRMHFRDVEPENALVELKGVAKPCGFGIAEQILPWSDFNLVSWPFLPCRADEAQSPAQRVASPSTCGPT